jgi:hypothetical protein
MIPFHTLSQRHLVYAYVVVATLQCGYGLWLAIQWRATRKHPSDEFQTHA